MGTRPEELTARLAASGPAAPSAGRGGAGAGAPPEPPRCRPRRAAARGRRRRQRRRPVTSWMGTRPEQLTTRLAASGPAAPSADGDEAGGADSEARGLGARSPERGPRRFRRRQRHPHPPPGIAPPRSAPSRRLLGAGLGGHLPGQHRRLEEADQRLLSMLNAVAGAYSENLPVICITGGPQLILHHTIGLLDFSQELRGFQTVTCHQAVVTNLDNAHISHMLLNARFPSGLESNTWMKEKENNTLGASELGVDTGPRMIGNLGIITIVLMSFDKEKDVNSVRVPSLEMVCKDFHACKWPSDLANDDESIALYFDKLNDCNEHGTIYAISSDFGDRMTTQSIGLTSLLSESF
ncbi:uncharacterized protein LOC120685799 isoform X2 [Panicum virgatum]|uniref:uncharacterized protein LOC120685799 isoform X2 n=1 Tax=Panicum virgatum TaxID=38727 RepID=UPI0019D56E12|nr:uncharacterized protein LOC120685799 isoform X2 [Panicum virgatum]